MKKLSFAGILLLALSFLTACGNASSNSSTKQTSQSSSSTSKSDVQSVLDQAASDLKSQLSASPVADMEQSLDPTIIPNFVGMTIDQANTVKASLKDATFLISMRNSIYREDLPEGTILAQSIKPGEKGNGRWLTYIASTQSQDMATTIDQAKF